MPTDPADEDEFDRQLRALTGGAAGEARYTEPSAAERARRAERRARQARRMTRPPRRPPLARRWSVWTGGALRRYQSWVVVLLILAALVAISVGLGFLSSH
jgi:hypothetical protein